MQSPLSQSILVFILVFIGIYARESFGGVTFSSPVSLQNTTFSAPELIWLPTKQNISGKVILYDRLNATECETESLYQLCADKVNGSIVFFSAFGPGVNLWPGISFEECWLRTRRWGASGVIYVNNVIPRNPGGGEVLITNKELAGSLKNILIVEMGYEDGELIYNALKASPENATFFAEISVGDRNIWREIRLGPAMIVFQVLTTVVAGIVSIAACTKLIAYIRVYGYIIGIAHLTLVLELGANLLRMIVCAIDPVYAGKYFNDQAAHILFSVTWPIGLINTCLISMYWQQLVTKSKMQVPSFLSKLKIPFIIVTIVIIILEFSTSGLRASHLGTYLSIITTINGLVYLVVLLALCIYFCIIGGKLLFRLNKSAKMTGSKRLLKKTTKFVILSMIFSLFFLASLGIGALTSVFFTPYMNFVACVLLYIGLLGGSLSRVLSLKTPLPGVTQTYTSDSRSTNSSKSQRDLRSQQNV